MKLEPEQYCCNELNMKREKSKINKNKNSNPSPFLVLGHSFYEQ